jgi:acyl-CoA thioesterase II
VPDLWSDLLACLDLHPVPSAGTREAGVDDDVTECEGPNQRLEYHATRNQEGRSFASVTITARQSVDEVPAVLGPGHRVALDLIPWETRVVVDLNATTGPPEFEVVCIPAVDPAPALVASYAQEALLRFAS